MHMVHGVIIYNIKRIFFYFFYMLRSLEIFLFLCKKLISGCVVFVCSVSIYVCSSHCYQYMPLVWQLGSLYHEILKHGDPLQPELTDKEYLELALGQSKLINLTSPHTVCLS